MFDAIIVMAGSGSRSGLDVNKVLYPISGTEVFIYSVRAFQKIKGLSKLILVINPRDEAAVKAILEHHHLEGCQIVHGGTTRAQSVRNGLSETASPKILIHDGARPMISAEDICAIDAALDEWDAATLVNSVYDTLKTVKDGIINGTLERSLIKKVITPQGIRASMIPYLLHPKMPDEAITDDMVVLETKVKVFAVASERPNIKLTTKGDIDLLEYFLKEGR